MIIVYILGIFLYLILMEKIFDALISHIVPDNKKYIPAWIILSLLFIIGGMLIYPLLNDFKAPLFYIFTLAAFAFWAQIFILFSNADIKRKKQQDMRVRVDDFHEIEKTILREFLLAQGPIVEIETPEPYLERLIDEQFVKMIGKKRYLPYIFQLSPIAVKIIRIKHLFSEKDFQQMRIPEEQRDWLLSEAIGTLHFDGDAWQRLLSLRHPSKRQKQQTSNIG